MPREIRAEHVSVTFDPLRHRATTAVASGSFKYADPKTTASAVRAHFDIVNDLVLLTAQPGFDPTVVFDGQTVKAHQIEFSPRSGAAKATGTVIAQVISKPNGQSADPSSVFPTSQPVFVNSDQLLIKQATRTAVFTGKVKAFQGTNTLFAQEMQVQSNGQVIAARGAVRTILYNAGSEQRKVPLTSSSEQLIARRGENRIELLGNVQIEDEARTMSAEKAVLFFDASRKIERVEAETKVVLVEKAMNRKVTGDKAVYHLNKKMAYLDGSPATATDPEGSLSGQQIVFDLARNKVRVGSTTTPTSGTYKQQ
jgi:lipopolysaccharide export system protein LptA